MTRPSAVRCGKSRPVVFDTRRVGALTMRASTKSCQRTQRTIMAVVSELLLLCWIASLAGVIALARDEMFFAVLFAMAGAFALGSAVLRSCNK
jgi:hypothetical protein